MEFSSNSTPQAQNESDPERYSTSITSTNTTLSRTRVYLIVQGLSLFPALVIPLWSHPPEPIVFQIFSISFVLFSGWSLYKMYQQNSLFFRMESFRLVSVFLLSAYLFKAVIASELSMLLLSSGVFISLIWLFILKPEFED